MDLLAGVPWQGLGIGGLLTLTVLLIIRGDLIPRKVHDEMRADRDRWRNAAETTLAQNSKLLSVGDLSVHALRSIEAKAQENADGGTT